MLINKVIKIYYTHIHIYIYIYIYLYLYVFMYNLPLQGLAKLEVGVKPQVASVVFHYHPAHESRV